jgi:hypothetical protein
VDLLEASESFKEKGSILVAMQDEERREEMEAIAEEMAQHEQQQQPIEGDESSEMDANSFNKSISSIMKESETILGRPPMVDPNRFSTALFCGTTASRQMVSSSPVNVVEGEEADEKSQVPDPYNDQRYGGGFDGQGVEQEFEGSAFADALEEVEEDDEAAAEAAVDPTDFTFTIDTSAPLILGNDEEEKKEEELYEDETFEDAYEEEEEEDAEVMMVEYSVR